MRFATTAAAVAALTGSAYGHARVYKMNVDGATTEASPADKPVYIRQPATNDPVKDITSTDIICNKKGATAVEGSVKVAAGSDISFEWYHNTQGDDIIDGSHKGPLQTWITPYVEGIPTGAVWTKLNTESYSGGKWPVDRLRDNKGVSEPVTIPASIKPGKYIIRHEIIALHESDTAYSENPARGAQFYPSCIQVDIEGTGSDVPPGTWDFQKDYTYTDKGIVYNLYNDDATTYVAPGPEPWTGGAGSGSGNGNGSSPAPTTSAAPVATSAAAAVPTTLATQVSSAAPAASSAAAAAPSATPSKAPSAGCKKRRSRKARRSAH
ncbi:putative endo-beta-1,4-glucanase D [Colletotrichum spinosum]|uniref:lytic cellulose monooxygenase (C4-dehydrogenating) n=1 Tax=Colletotrichum spinosum TaxID=1347390 RepID=A0A4R8QP36_9PEZI|nr:putative endo-beta-1,4-glucanase D [Colletotrichum spinosum]